MRSLLLLVALLLLACSGGDDAVGASATAEPVPTSTPSLGSAGPIDVDTVDLTRLVTWKYLFDAGQDPFGSYDSTLYPQYPPPADLADLVVALAAAEDGRYEAVLTDLAFLPTGYGELALKQLLQKEPPFSDADFLAAVEQRGFREPDEDSRRYLLFKQALFATIFDEFAAFLDPEAPRTISAQEVFWGGVRVDGIPPLDSPRFLTAADAGAWILADDEIIGVEINGDARAYPRRIIDWHEMVNDTVGGVPVSLAYCTLCGSAILYDGRYGDQVFRFGTSGLLYRSNKLMYDRGTRTLWEQFTGEPAWGSLVGAGIRLTTLPVVHTTWEAWLAAHPDTKVLDIDTGYSRDYGSGVAYRDYWASSRLIFPAPNRDGPLERKDSVYAVRVGDLVTAYPIDLLASRGVIHDRIGEQSVLLIATEDGSGGRAYAGGELRFSALDGAAGDLESDDGRRWQITEAVLISDDGTELERLPGHNAFWFAVTNHAASWRLYE